MNLDNEARTHTKLQWNTNPCGSVGGSNQDLQYFLDVEKERYRQQYWQLNYFDFSKFKGKKVLEIGIGHGTDLMQFAKAGAECYGIDITEKHIQLTPRNFDLRGYPVDVKECDATAIDAPDNYFDCVYSFGVLHHIPEIKECVAEVNRVLKPGGTFYMSLYYKYSLSHLMLVLYGLATRKIFKLGYKNLLSLIESGADGIKIKPFVKLYSKTEVKNLLKKFQLEKIDIRQINFEDFKFLNKLRLIHKYIGWYVISTAKKKILNVEV